MNVRRLLAATAMLVACSGGAVFAQQAPAASATSAPADATNPETQSQRNPLAEREKTLAPVLSWMQALGVKLTYLGDEGGLSGYLAEDATGKMQTIYVTPDREHVVAGLLLKKGGDNITGVQVGEMRERFSKAADQYVPKDAVQPGQSTVKAPEAAKQPSASAPAPDAPKADAKGEEDGKADPEPAAGGSTTPEATPATDKAAAVSGKVPETKGSETPAPSVSQPGTAQPAAAATPTADKAGPAEAGPVALPEATGPISGAEGNPAELWVSKIDKDTFLKAAEAAPYFEVGSMQAPITIYEIADPQCPYCHAAWQTIKPLVFDKKVKLRVILIAALNGSEPKAREILASAIPARRWIESDAGKNFKQEMDHESQPFKDSGAFLEKNMDFARKFGVDKTPFLGYVGFDGQFYTAPGLPSDIESFLSAAVAK